MLGLVTGVSSVGRSVGRSVGWSVGGSVSSGIGSLLLCGPAVACFVASVFGLLRASRLLGLCLCRRRASVAAGCGLLWLWLFGRLSASFGVGFQLCSVRCDFVWGLAFRFAVHSHSLLLGLGVCCIVGWRSVLVGSLGALASCQAGSGLLLGRLGLLCDIVCGCFASRALGCSLGLASRWVGWVGWVGFVMSCVLALLRVRGVARWVCFGLSWVCFGALGCSLGLAPRWVGFVMSFVVALLGACVTFVDSVGCRLFCVCRFGQLSPFLVFVDSVGCLLLFCDGFPLALCFFSDFGGFCGGLLLVVGCCLNCIRVRVRVRVALPSG